MISVQELLPNLLKIFVIMVCGGMIGLEREKSHKTAGLRTCLLVGLGATVFTIIAVLVKDIEGQNALGRILACIVSGIGFLGASVVWRNEDSIEGITTASVLWTMVGVGILVGIGEYILASIITVCILFVLKLKYLRFKIITLKGKKNNGRK